MKVLLTKDLLSHAGSALGSGEDLTALSYLEQPAMALGCLLLVRGLLDRFGQIGSAATAISSLVVVLVVIQRLFLIASLSILHHFVRGRLGWQQLVDVRLILEVLDQIGLLQQFLFYPSRVQA